MIQIFVKYFISLIISFLIITSNTIAFHKQGNSEIDVDHVEGIKKKEIQSQYCTIQVEKIPKINDQEKEKKETEDQSTEEKKKEFIYKVISYHGNAEEAPKELDFSILKNKINKNTYIGPVSTIEDLLNYYCVQEIPEGEKSYIYKKGNPALFDEIAQINGYSGKDAQIEGQIYDTGKINLSIEGKILIYAKAQFIIDEEKRLKNKKAKEEKQRKAKEEKERKAKEKREREAKEERDWIAENKPPLIKKIKEKIQNFDDKITKYNNSVNALTISHDGFTKYFEEKFNEIEDFLDFVDVGEKQIKDKAALLKKAKREYLNNNIIKDIDQKFKEISNKKGKDFKTYRELKALYEEVQDSKKRKHFEKEHRSKFWKKKKPGYFTQWDRLSDRELDIDKFFKKIDELNSDMKSAETNIINNIDVLKSEIQTLEEELENQFPIMEIVIGIIIFLIICGVGYFVYDSSQKRKKEKQDAESKIESLKSDLEGKLKSTSEQIKSVSRNTQRSQQNPLKTEEIVEEKPKTPEEIIAEKYDELLSDYKEALDDFTKVAGFKQKWHGLALSRKERQEGTKTILVNSSRAFEKAEIWCVTFSEKYFAFPGSTVKSNMATYMNLDFEKASRDFKGVFAVSTGSSYTTEPCVLRRGGAGFVVERVGKIIFPN
ncbi:hypothetical protein [Candidatus Pelagibacter sp. FZCC0015]|uniref:hypothetical protein n=1 Tax=Candidatus Pelagibacter sp. FZCC0015 TaxID=2268451 RepID=UPI0011AACF30|nr:hypothetical protein [Candidatus Pelagibacter sp. FZCC0015]